jgi:hypothetical protein
VRGVGYRFEPHAEYISCSSGFSPEKARWRACCVR